MSFIMSILNTLKMVGGVFLPMFYRGGRALSKVGSTLVWIFHFLMLAAILVVLTYVNQKYFKRNLTDIPFVDTFWLPLLFLAFYALIWLIWWLVALLGMEPDPSDYPDIDSAWQEALVALDKAGIGVADVPIFLVLGRPASGEEILFNAAGLNLQVSHAPNRAAPLHVYANRDSIYITCAGVSLLGQQIDYFEGKGPTSAAQPSSGGYDDGGRGTANDNRTMRPDEMEPVKKIKDFLDEISRQGRAIHQLSPEEKIALKRLEEQGSAGDTTRRIYLHGLTDEVQRINSRFEHLCRLIVHERQPYCPINGILALLPLAGTDRNEDASEVGSCLADDIATAHRVFRVNCPILTLACDLERLPGFKELIQSMARSQLFQRVGQRFPYLPDIKVDQLPGMLEAGIQWIGLSLFPSLTYALLRLESIEKNDYSEAVRGNVRLFRFLTEIRERQKNLGHILTRGFANGKDEPPMFGGCYLAGTGQDALSEQAFIKGVFERPSKDQEFVSWTDEAVQDEAACKKWTAIGYGLIVTIVLVTVGGMFLYMKNKNG